MDLEARVREIEARLLALEAKLGGLSPREELFTVTVGGKRVELRALPPSEWVSAAGELPAFVLSLVKAEAGDKEALDFVVETAKRWISACAIPGQDYNLDRLTLPEAVAAVSSIAEANGITEGLRRFFRERGVDAAT